MNVFFTKHILYKVKPQYRKIAAGIPEADGMSFLAGVPEVQHATPPRFQACCTQGWWFLLIINSTSSQSQRCLSLNSTYIVTLLNPTYF